jgi:poly-gamma-glutamate synthesis protein (capsule biosynthesis protein)
MGVRRYRTVVAVLIALAALLVGVVGAGIALTEPPPPPAPPPPAVIVRDVPLGPDGKLSVQFVGDTMLGDAAQPLLDQRGYDWPFQAVGPMLTGDFVVAVAEAPISSLTLPWSLDKEFSYSTRPDTAGAMARAGIDAVTLANNHVFDVGPVGLSDTIHHLEVSGIAAFGAGPDAARARQPLLLRTELGTIGIVGMGESYGNRAGRDEPGTRVFSPEAIQRGAEIARLAGAKWVVAFVHWGDNYTPVNGEQRYWAQEFVTAGYDLVVGSGPHFAQPIEFVGPMPVIYSIGNFVFGAPGRFAEYRVPGVGLSVGVELSADGATQLAVRCLLTDNAVVGYQPRPCTSGETQAHLRALHPQMAVHGDLGVLPCSCFARREGE